jgi:hypothetical protein
MPDREFKIVFVADTSNAIGGMQKVGAELKMLESYINSTGSGLEKMHSQVSDMATGCNVASDSLRNMGQASGGALQSMIAMSAGFLAIQGGIQILGEFGDLANKARDRVVELTAETMGLRDQMRELANLKGAGGPDNVILGRTIEMAMDAVMMPEEMVKYLEQFEGSIPAGEQKKHIDRKTKDELALEGAKFGARVKLAPHTAGDLAGIIPQYTDLTHDKNGKEIPQDQRTARAMTQMGRVEYGLNMGRGKLEDLTRSMINTAGAVVGQGGIEDLGELAAIQGVASTHANPKESGTRVRQAVRALRDTQGDAKLFLTKTAGIEDGDSHIERLEKVKVQIDKAKANGKQGDDYLRSVGFKNEDELRAVQEQVEDLDIIKKRIAEGRRFVTGKAVMRKDDKFQTNERVGVRRKQMATKAGQEILMGEESERYVMAKENAEQRQRQAQAIGGPWHGAREMIGDFFGIRTKLLGGESMREKGKGQWAEQALIREAERLGIDEETARFQYLGEHKMLPGQQTNLQRSEGERVKGFNKLATEVERRGGNPYGEGANLGPHIGAMIKEQQETNKILRQAMGNGGPQAGLAQPAGGGMGGALPPVRGAAAPKRGP